MNLYKSLLFLHGHIVHPELVEDAEESYAEGYGNRIASARAFGPLGHKRDVQPAGEAEERKDECPVGGCA